jgi:magnesium chelatase family protein
MLARVASATMIGLQAVSVQVEVDLNQGTPLFVMIGLASKTVEEAKERITTALRNCDIHIRSRRTIVNLAPADIRKNSSVLELAIAVGLLKSYQEIVYSTDDTIFFGELSLDGSIRSICGALPLVLAAKKAGFKRVVLPSANLKEVSTITGIIIHPLSHLSQLLTVSQVGQLNYLKPKKFTVPPQQQFQAEFIQGQTLAKRALVIAAAGHHHLMLTGPPGAGKSLLAQSLVDLMPPLTKAESLEVTSIHSIVGLVSAQQLTQRPFRAPHHSCSVTSLLGGTSSLRPGEVSLAHRGILFLDEFTEFKQLVIDSLRQPLQEKTITIQRATGEATFPADFLLVAAANPCRCGYFGSKFKDCSCTAYSRQLYQARISGPIWDRIDLHVQVEKVQLQTLAQNQDLPTQLHQYQQAVIQAQVRQAKHFRSIKKKYNSQLNNTQVKGLLTIAPAAEKLLITAGNQLNLSARSFYRMLKVAQTIADLEAEDTIQPHHIAETLQLRQN